MKGILKTFEVVIALAIVMLAFISLYTGDEQIPELETVTWRTQGMNALQSLDYANQLRYDAMNNNTAVIQSRISPFLAANVNSMVLVCSDSCVVPNITAEKSTSVSYFISGEPRNSTNREIILYMWSNE